MSIDLKNHVITNLRERGVFMIFQILLTLLLPFVTTPEVFGLLSIVLNNIAFALIVTSAGISSALTYYASKPSSNAEQLLRFLTISTLLQLAVITGIELAVWKGTSRFLLWPSNELLFGIAGILLYLGYSLSEKVSAVYNGLLKNRYYIRMSTIFLCLQIIVLALNHYFNIYRDRNASILIVVTCTFIQGLSLFIHFYTSKNDQKQKQKEQTIEWKAYLSFALPAYIANLVQFLATKSDVWLIDFFYTKTEVGYYSFATKLGQMLLILPLMVASIAFPLLTSKKMSTSRFEQIIRITNGGLMMIHVVAIGLGILCIPFIWGEEYIHSINPFLFSLPGYFAQAQIALYAAYFASKASIKTNIQNSLITLSIILILDLFFIPFYGITGGAISFSIANIASSIWMIRKYNLENSSFSIRLLPTKNDLTFI